MRRVSKLKPFSQKTVKLIRGRPRFCILLFLLTGVAGTDTSVLAQSVLDEIGFTALKNELGTSLANGSSVDIALIEPGSSYLPNLTNSFLVGKSINNISGTSNAISGHSTQSALRLMGTGGVTPAADNVDVYSAEDWVNNRINYLGTSDPAVQGYDVTTHSYIIANPGSSSTDPEDVLTGEISTAAVTDLLTRIDFVNARDNTSMFVGSSNGNSNTLPYAMVPAYNAIAVGRTDGNHGAGETTFYGAGRTKVDLVVPETATSRATPVAAAAGSLLIDSAGIGSDGANNQVVRATLLAGATKEEFSSWDRTTTRPLDERFGAGELNIYNSYHIQQGGQQSGSSTQGGTLVSPTGWDYVESFNPLTDRYYTFEVGAAQELESLSIALSWNLRVTDTSPSSSAFTPITSLANFDLQLSDLNGNVVDISESAVDNVEHIFVQRLSEGVYHLRVSGDLNESYGLAWRGNLVSAASAVPEPGGSAILLAMVAITIANRSRSQSFCRC